MADWFRVGQKRNEMKTYRVVKRIHLDFLTERDQVILAFEDGFVFSDGVKSWYSKTLDGERRETINWNHVIEWYVEDGCLTKV
jgi:hypothetical protein